MDKYRRIIDKFQGQKILVIGDLVLDRYIKGSVSRISPEAPVPIVLQEDSFYTPGGAANVANNLSSLGADVTIVGKVGDDIEGAVLKRELSRCRIRTTGVFVDQAMSTVFKTRIIAQHQQVVRLDRESPSSLGTNTLQQEKIIPFLKRRAHSCKAIIISDYGKGMINAGIVSAVLEWSLSRKIPVVVDPKIENLRAYGQVSCITPNKKEAEAALRAMSEEARRDFGIRSLSLDCRQDIESCGRGLLAYLGIESLLITLGEQGMYLFEHNQEPYPIPTRAQEVYDISGAGDTVISVFALCLAAGASRRQAADIANYGAGVVVGKMGAVAVGLDELKQAVLSG